MEVNDSPPRLQFGVLILTLTSLSPQVSTHEKAEGGGVKSAGGWIRSNSNWRPVKKVR